MNIVLYLSDPCENPGVTHGGSYKSPDPMRSYGTYTTYKSSGEQSAQQRLSRTMVQDLGSRNITVKQEDKLNAEYKAFSRDEHI